MRGVPSLVNPESPSHHQAGKTQFSLGEKPRCVCVCGLCVDSFHVHIHPFIPVFSRPELNLFCHTGGRNVLRLSRAV